MVLFALVVITLSSYLISPAKTQTALRLLHHWLQAHRRLIVIVLSTAVGLQLSGAGSGIL